MLSRFLNYNSQLHSKGEHSLKDNCYISFKINYMIHTFHENKFLNVKEISTSSLTDDQQYQIIAVIRLVFFLRE